MTIFTQGPRVRDRLFEETPVGLGESVAAQVSDAWIRSPLSSLGRSAELTTLMEGPVILPSGKAPYSYEDPYTGERSGPESPIVPADEARKTVRDKGLQLKVPDAGISQDALNELIERKQEERMRQHVLANAPSGFFPGVARFGAAIGVSMLDPINVASAFVPVVGQARYAALLKSAGSGFARAGVRARVGAVEGVVGQALVEPIVYSAAQQEQADYGLADSLLAIGFGTVLGGGLHMGAGAIGDAIRKGKPWQTAEPTGATAERVARWSQQEREAVGRIAIAQAVSGRRIDVEPIVRLRDSLAELRPASIEEARFQAIESLRATMREELLPEVGRKLSRGEVKQLQQERAAVAHQLENLDETFKATAKRLQQEQKLSRKQAEAQARKAVDADRLRLQERAAVLDRKLSKNDSAKAAEADLSRLDQNIVPERFKPLVEERARADFENGRIRETQVSAGVRQALSGPEARVDDAWKNLRRAADRQNAPEADDLADFRAADMTIEDLRTAPAGTRAEVAQEFLAEAQEALDDLARQMDVDYRADMAPLDEALNQAQTMSKAMRALAVCNRRSV